MVIIAYLYTTVVFVLGNIYNSSVFCYDKHKKNFYIKFSMKRDEPV